MRLIDADRLANLMQNDLEGFETMISEHGGGLAHGTRIALKRVEEQPTIAPENPQPRWIPCSERLPEMHEEEFCDETYRTSDTVLLCTADRVHVGCCVRCNDELFWEIEYGQTCANVTAWMPMPEAYSEED